MSVLADAGKVDTGGKGLFSIVLAVENKLVAALGEVSIPQALYLLSFEIVDVDSGNAGFLSTHSLFHSAPGRLFSLRTLHLLQHLA